MTTLAPCSASTVLSWKPNPAEAPQIRTFLFFQVDCTGCYFGKIISIGIMKSAGRAGRSGLSASYCTTSIDLDPLKRYTFQIL